MRQLLDKPRELAALLAISFSFFLLRFPSLFEPNWYGDEGIYQAIGIAMREGRMLYSEIWGRDFPDIIIVDGCGLPEFTVGFFIG